MVYKFKRKVLTEWLAAMLKVGITAKQAQDFLAEAHIQASRNYKDRISTKKSNKND